MLSKESFLRLAAESYPKIAALQTVNNFYDYETAFAEIMKDLGRQTLEGSISDLSANRRKKKHLPDLGR